MGCHRHINSTLPTKHTLPTPTRYTNPTKDVDEDAKEEEEEEAEEDGATEAEEVAETEQRWWQKNNVSKLKNLKRNNKLLEYEERQPNYIEQLIIKIGERDLHDTYGFIADPEKDIWQNVNIRLGNLTMTDYFNKILQSSYHNLCTYLTPPPGLGSLLGLGLKCCIKYNTPLHDSLTNAIERMKRDVRLKYLFAGEKNNNYFNKKLYIKSDWDPPKQTPI